MNVTLAMLSDLGPRWFAQRSLFEVKRRSGWLTWRYPCGNWEAFTRDSMLRADAPSTERLLENRRQGAVPFFFQPADRGQIGAALSHLGDRSGILGAALKVTRGIVASGAGREVDLSDPAEWLKDPVSGARWPGEVHWSKLDEFGQADIRTLWEAARFASAFTLVRAHWREPDERYPQAFWSLLEGWMAHCPPHCGPHWKCGQEASFRLFALLFGLQGFLESPSTTPERMLNVLQVAQVTGQRIESAMEYALSQRNNHAISEAAGLLTLGLACPELRGARRWRAIGRKHLETQSQQLFYADGGFAQHSSNYQRVALHTLVWAMRLTEIAGDRVPRKMYDTVSRATEFLFSLQDEGSGEVPRYGNDDGSRLFPLEECSRENFRPVLAQSSYLCEPKRIYSPGAWDEGLVWFFGSGSLASPLVPLDRRELSAPTGGCHTLSLSGEGRAVVRAARFAHRPSQADQLHADLWWKGNHLTLDPGTSGYNAPPPWDGGLGGTAVHNTVSVDGRDQMDRLGRFYWHPWAEAKAVAIRRSGDGGTVYGEFSHRGYERLAKGVRHRRGILGLRGLGWIVVDRLLSSGQHRYRLQWLFPGSSNTFEAQEGLLNLEAGKGPFQIRVSADRPHQTSLVSADPLSQRGWTASTYGQMVPALSLACEAEGSMVEFVTVVAPVKAEVSRTEDGWCATMGGNGSTVAFRSADKGLLLSEIKVVRGGDTHGSWTPVG